MKCIGYEHFWESCYILSSYFLKTWVQYILLSEKERVQFLVFMLFNLLNEMDDNYLFIEFVLLLLS